MPPFYGNTDPEILDSVRKGVFSFNSKLWGTSIILLVPEFKGVGDSAKDLISKMICKPEKRLKADECLKHPWLVKPDEPNSFLQVNFQSLKGFTQFNKLKKVTLTYIAS